MMKIMYGVKMPSSPVRDSLFFSLSKAPFSNSLKLKPSCFFIMYQVTKLLITLDTVY